MRTNPYYRGGNDLLGIAFPQQGGGAGHGNPVSVAYGGGTTGESAAGAAPRSAIRPCSKVIAHDPASGFVRRCGAEALPDNQCLIRIYSENSVEDSLCVLPLCLDHRDDLGQCGKIVRLRTDV